MLSGVDRYPDRQQRSHSVFLRQLRNDLIEKNCLLLEKIVYCVDAHFALLQG